MQLQGLLKSCIPPAPSLVLALSGIYLFLCWAVCQLSRKLFAFTFFYFFFIFFIPLFLFFSLPGCLSAIWAHWNWLSAGSDKPWNQPKKGQKCVDCRKDVISFISLGLDHLVAWNDSMVVNEYGWGDEFLPKASRSMSKMANNITSLLSEVRTSKQWVSKVSARLI